MTWYRPSCSLLLLKTYGGRLPNRHTIPADSINEPVRAYCKVTRTRDHALVFAQWPERLAHNST